eukprot:jgi/Mesvir1/7608/Mv06339-RA.1
MCVALDVDGNEDFCELDAEVDVVTDPLAAKVPPYLIIVEIQVANSSTKMWSPANFREVLVAIGLAGGLALSTGEVVVWRAKSAEDLSGFRPRRSRHLLEDGGVLLTIYFGSATPAGIDKVEAWFLNPASAATMQQIFFDALGEPVGDVVVSSVRSGGGACCLPPSPDPVCVVDEEIDSSAECLEVGRTLLPNVTKAAVWLGPNGQCVECAQLWGGAGASSDPHFVTADGTHFDWMGQGDRSFCIISDKAVHVNAHLFAGTDGRRKGTWVDQIAVLHGGDHVVVSTGAAAGFPGLHGSMSINGRADMSVGSSASAVVAKGFTMRRKKTRTWVTVEGILELEVEVVRASTWEAGRGPARDFLNFRVHGLNATESVHGVLGQTFRPATQGATKSALKGLVEGTDPDYMTTGLLAADCSFSQFSMTSDW